MIKGVDHISIVVKNLEEGLEVYEKLLGIKHSHQETLADQGVKAAMIMVGNVEVELIEPLSADSGVGKFLEKKGEGIHHICLRVDDVDKELEAMSGKGIDLIDKKGRKGLAGKVGFLHPRSTNGVLIELAQKV
ncbi:MAG: methylmalonyl-CoA epimerase [Dehalococcoidia bacterium]|nr:methylmalonyl-CoA epimerase [Dehalococcoidia bacterium]